MQAVNSKKAVMIGCGFVGSASVFALMQSGLFTEIVLIDADKGKAEGEAMDISHGIPFARPMKIYAGDYDDVADAAKDETTYLNRMSKEVDLYFLKNPKRVAVNAAGLAEMQVHIVRTLVITFIIGFLIFY